jgi:hypothetical protein
MTYQAMNHLSDEALSDVLIGMGSAEAESHLAACAVCRGKVEEFRAGLDVLNAATLAWSEDRARRAPRIHAPSPADSRLYWPRVAALGWSLVAVVLLALVVPLWHPAHWFAPIHSAAVVAPPEDSQEQIAQDNELLKAVDAAIHPNEILPLKQVGLLERPHPRHRQRPH